MIPRWNTNCNERIKHTQNYEITLLREGGREGKGTDLVTLEMSEHSKTKAKGTSHKHRTLAGKVEGWGWGGNS